MAVCALGGKTRYSCISRTDVLCGDGRGGGEKALVLCDPAAVRHLCFWEQTEFLPQRVSLWIQ